MDKRPGQGHKRSWLILSQSPATDKKFNPSTPFSSSKYGDVDDHFY
jgi:hypothetical protein